MGRKLVKIGFLSFKEYQDPYYQGIAAQLAYYLMLSIVPTLLVLSQVLGLLDISVGFLTTWIDNNVKSSMAAALRYFINDKSTVATTNIVLIVLAVWAASRIQYSLTRITDYTYSGGTDLGNYWKDRLRSMFTLIITIAVIALTIVLLVYAEIFIKNITSGSSYYSFTETFIKYFRWPIAGAVYFFIVSFNYYVLPTEKKPFKEILPGSIFAAISMLVVTVFYAIYVTRSVSYDLVYGSLASIVILMIWFYFIAWVICIGIFINKAWLDYNEENV